MQQQPQQQIHPNIQQFIQAIEILFSPTEDSSLITKANKYLTDFIKTREAWDAVPILFNTPQNDKCFRHKIYNAAIILKKKICFNFKEIQNIQTIFEYILNALCSFKSIKIVTSHLSQALAALCIQSNTWTDYFPIIITKLNPNDQSNVPVLLNIFSSIAEAELKISFADTLYLDSLRNNLRLMTPSVLDFIQKSANVNPNDCLDCLSTWMKFVEFEFKYIVQYDLLSMIFEGMKHDQTRNCATEAFNRLTMMLQNINENSTDEEIAISIQIVQKILNDVVNAIPFLVNLTKDNEFEIQLVTEFYCDVGYLLTLYHDNVDPAMFIKYYLLLPEFSSFRNDKIMTAVSDCLKNLVTMLNEMGNKQVREQIRQQLQDVYVKMMMNIIKIQGIYGTYEDEEDEEEFIAFRKEILSWVIRDIKEIVPPQILLNMIGTACSESIKTNQTLFESALFAFRSLARVFENDPSELILTILQNIIKTDITEPKVLHTCVFCVGRYCDWMNKYAPQFAIEAFKYILKHLQNPQLFETASVTFEMMCDGCANHLVPYFNDISNVFSQIFSAMPRNWSIGKNNANYSTIIDGFMKLVEKTQPEIRVKTFTTLLQPIICELKQQQDPMMISVFCEMTSKLLKHGYGLNVYKEVMVFLNQMEFIQTMIKIMNISIQQNNKELIQKVSDCFVDITMFVNSFIGEFMKQIVQQLTQWWNMTHSHDILNIYYSLCRSLSRHIKINVQQSYTNLFSFIPQFLDEVMQYITSQQRSNYEDELVDVFDIVTLLMTSFGPYFDQSTIPQRLIPWAMIALETTNSYLFKSITYSLTEFFVKETTAYSNQILQSDMFVQLVSVIIKYAVRTPTSGFKKAVESFLFLCYKYKPEIVSKAIQTVLLQSYSFIPQSLISQFGDANLNGTDFTNLIIDFFYICKETY